MVRRSIARAAAMLALAECAACSGGSHAALPSALGTGGQSGSPASAGRATVSFTVRVPRPSANAAARTPRYLSANTASVAIAVASSGAAAPAPVVANLTPASPNCSAGSAGTTCTVAVPAPIGNDTFTVTTYAGPDAGGSVLSTSTVTGTIAGGAVNTIPISLGGVVASLALSLPATPAQGGMAAVLPLTIVAKDASGATILGSDPFATPITLTDSDASGATSLSTTSLTSPATAVTVLYTGTYLASAVSISASTPNVTVTSAAFRNTATHIYVGDHASDNVYVFPAAASGAVTPSAFQSTDAANATYAPYSAVAGLTVSPVSGNVFVLYNLTDGASVNFSEISEFPPAAGGTVTPVRTIGGAAATTTDLDPGSSDIAVDGAGKVYVDGTSSGPGANSILVFSASATGNAAPAAILASGNAGGIAVTTDGTLYATLAGSSPSITTLAAFAPGASGTAAPIASLTPATSGVLALDAAGNLYNGGIGGASGARVITEYARSGNTFSVVRTIGAASGVLTNPGPVAVDQAGYIYVANEATNGTIVVFAPDASGTAVPVRTMTATTASFIPGQVVVGR